MQTTSVVSKHYDESSDDDTAENNQVFFPQRKRIKLDRDDKKAHSHDEESDDDEETDEEADQIHIQTESNTNGGYGGKDERDEETTSYGAIVATHTQQRWEVIENFKPDLRPKLPKSFQSSQRTSIDQSNSSIGQWPTYIHLPVRLGSEDQSLTASNHHMEKKITLLSENQIHVSITPTKLFSYPICLEIARILYEVSRELQRARNSNRAKSMQKFNTSGVGVLRNIQGANNILYFVHYVEEKSPVVSLVHEIQRKLVSPENQKPYFELLDDWNVHITVGKYDTMGNVSEKQIIEWTNEATVSLEPPVRWIWDRSIVMYCGNKKFVWNC